MRHTDHHTLELYALSSEKERRENRRVQRHLAGCPHCRGILGEIEELYSSAGSVLESRARAASDARDATARRMEALLQQRMPVEVEAAPARRGGLQRLARFARNHSLLVITSSFGTVALAGFALGVFMRNGPTDLNPARFHYESARGALVVQNSAGESLWEKTIWNMPAWEQTELSRKIQFTGIADLNGDGRNEVVTSLPFLPYEGLPSSSTLRIIDERGKELTATLLGHDVRYDGREYPAGYFGHGGLVILSPNRQGEREILVTVPGFRSPSLLARVDAKGRILGEYWHYGHLAGIYGVATGPDGADRIAITGINDVHEERGDRAAVIILLDPGRIRGTTESTASRGFGYDPAEGELVYLRVPKTDIGSALAKQPVVTRLVSRHASEMRFVVSTALDEPLGGFEFVFSDDLRARTVLALDGVEAVHTELLRRGRITSRLDSAYFHALKQGVRYWDGRAWRDRHTRVLIPASIERDSSLVPREPFVE